jgi:DNA-binding Lrp family transcriptional regulator
MDAYDKQILDIIQSHFPLTSRPYEEVGKQVGLSEADVLGRVRDMKKSGLIRRMGANFSSQSLGWQSTLCAASVPEDKLDAFVAEVNGHDGVTHNYLRENKFNVWFALIAPDMDAVEAILASITEATGITVLNLPASKLFKIKVDFKMDK